MLTLIINSYIESSDLNPNCHCSGSWKLTTTRESFKKRIETINSVATFHNLSLLEEHSKGILESY